MRVLVECNAVGVAFVSTELDLALTFASIALGSQGNSEQRRRNESSARIAYDSAVRFSTRLTLSGSEADLLAAKRHHVESALRQLVVSG